MCINIEELAERSGYKKTHSIDALMVMAIGIDAIRRSPPYRTK